jgi:uncharacterized repeat protein (TIGR01451 family)
MQPIRREKVVKFFKMPLLAAAALALLVPAAAMAAGGGGGGGSATGADLQVSGSSDNGSPVSGQPNSYTFLVRNSGPAAATGATFADDLPAGVQLSVATVNGFAAPCSSAPEAAGGTAVSCSLGSLAKGGQTTVRVAVAAPPTTGALANTGRVASAVADPKPADNAVTVTVNVGSSVCALPAGEPTTTGLVMQKFVNSRNLLENFTLATSSGVIYTVLTNFYDPTANPLTSVINLACQPSPNLFISGGNFVNVTGTIGSEVVPPSTTPVPVIHASVVQVMTFKDQA